MKKLVIAMLCVIIELTILVPHDSVEAKMKLSTKSVKIEVGKVKTIKLKSTKKQAKWNIKTGGKYIKLKARKKKSVKVMGKKVGVAKIQCKVGKKRLICKVIVTKKKKDKNLADISQEKAISKLRANHIPTENRLMEEPLKKINLPQEDAEGFPVWYPYGSDIHYFFGSTVDRRNIEKIGFTDMNTVPQNALGSLDVSEKQNRSVMAWYTDEDRDGYYEMMIGQEGGVIANPNSQYLFSDIAPMETKENSIIHGLEYLYTDEVVNMKKMFIRFGMGGEGEWRLDLGKYFNTAKVENVSHMFEYFGANSTNEIHLYLGEAFDTTHIEERQLPFLQCNAYVHVSSQKMQDWIVLKQLSGNIGEKEKIILG